MTYTEWSELTTEEKLNFINTKLANRDVEPINTKKKTLHISHNDLDGVGCVAVAMMLGIEESGNALNLYNIILNPLFRGQGIGSQAIAEVFGNDNAIAVNKEYGWNAIKPIPLV